MGSVGGTHTYTHSHTKANSGNNKHTHTQLHTAVPLHEANVVDKQIPRLHLLRRHTGIHIAVVKLHRERAVLINGGDDARVRAPVPIPHR